MMINFNKCFTSIKGIYYIALRYKHICKENLKKKKKTFSHFLLKTEEEKDNEDAEKVCFGKLNRLSAPLSVGK